ncbi:MAG TPA: hypothetical protein VFH29_04850 [Anaerolineales bacterium]|nr:hypothetical protein [Anaerolineales bacterium]
MFPEPVSMLIREPQDNQPTVLYPIVASPNHVQAALRIRAALRAAHQDDAEVRPPEGQWHEWTWSLKAPPRPPLVLTSTEELNSEDLLANDSLGG